MKIRAITTGINLFYLIDETKIRKATEFTLRAKKSFENYGYEVQEPRITTQPWKEYLGKLKLKQIINEIKKFEMICKSYGIDFASIGTVTDSKFISMIPEIIKETDGISTTVTIGDIKNDINYGAARLSAKAIIEISKETERGYGNFRFAAIANCPSDIPFFPASYHKGRTCFSIGLECSDLVFDAFEKSRNLIEAEENLKTIFDVELEKIQHIAMDIEEEQGINFHGIDVSPAPSLEENESIAFAFEKLNLGKFGTPGTLAVAGMVTKVLKSLDVKKCGYSGLMLPILEDVGLAERCNEGLLNVDNILSYSSVSGTGLDCIPLPGDVSENEIYAILLDMTTLSIKLNKPLSARLFPIPNKYAGEMTNFKSPFLVDCKIIKVK